MRERLKFPKQLDGKVWRYRNTGFDLPMHRHSELEVNLAARGTARYLFHDRRIDLRPGMQIWMFPAQEHVLVDRSPDYEMWIAVFRVGMIRRVCTSPRTATLRKSDPHEFFCRQLLPDQTTRLARLFAELAENAIDPATHNTGIAWLMLSAWAEYQKAAARSQGENIHPAVEHAARLIRDKTDALSLDELADQCRLSPSRLSRLFKQQTGVTLVRYRQRERLQRLVAMLSANPKMTILQAVYASGFGSYPQFHRVFEQEMGTTPRSYFVARR